MFLYVYMIVGIITVFSIGSKVVLQNKESEKTILWILLSFFLPPIAWVFYFWFGQSYRIKKSFINKNISQFQRIQEIKSELIRNGFYEEIKKESMIKRNISTLFLNDENAVMTKHNEMQIYKDGLTAIPSILDSINNAKEYIHIVFYIINQDALGEEFKNLLIKKAKEGIEVKVLYDALGSRKLKKKYINDCKKYNIEILPFFPLKFLLFNTTLNYRNHRKIVIVDGKEAYTGGLNIGDEYLGKDPKLGYWRDTHVKVIGESVEILQAVFLNDWICANGKIEKEEKYFYKSFIKKEEKIQVIHGGPDTKWHSILHLIHSMISLAQKSIVIETPYLILTESIRIALITAAIRGIAIHIVIPYKEKTDSKFCWYSSFSYIEELLEAGIKVYQYKKGFMHAKVCIIDDEIATIGCANINNRSFFLDFEENLIVYDKENINILKNHFEEDLKDSEEVIYSHFRQRKTSQRYKESLSRIFSPLM